jgi:tRNA (cmo5U34)-methyltransferase
MMASNPNMSAQVSDTMTDVRSFFTQLTNEYDEAILTAIPPYHDMLQAMLNYTFTDRQSPVKILELGCGSGNVAMLLSKVFPNSTLTLVDLSKEMLDLTAQKMAEQADRLTLIEADFMSLNLAPEQFDLVVASLSLHHLLDDQKQVVYDRIFQWMTPGAEFRCADQCLALPEASNQHNFHAWQSWIERAGAKPENVALWLDHAAKYDHYAPLFQHFQWLAKSGFVEIDCYWRTLFWNVFGASKPA